MNGINYYTTGHLTLLNSQKEVAPFLVHSEMSCMDGSYSFPTLFLPAVFTLKVASLTRDLEL